jgi:hypothetical protein
MRCAEGGKIDTVLYSASWGALNSSECAGNAAAVTTNPARAMAKPHNARVLLPPPYRSHLSLNPIATTLPIKKSRENYRSAFTVPRPAA